MTRFEPIGARKPVRRMVVGITGATGIIYGVRLLEALRTLEIETHLVVSKAADMTRAYETSLGTNDIRALADFVYSPQDIGASIASGSFKTIGMIVAPCSIRTLSDIAHGITSGLISRAADVVLKERRRLVLLVRETPLHAATLRACSRFRRWAGSSRPRCRRSTRSRAVSRTSSATRLAAPSQII